MKEFVTWVMADAARQKEGASAGFIRFMAERTKCDGCSRLCDQPRGDGRGDAMRKGSP
jgi:hypothetical protein